MGKYRSLLENICKFCAIFMEAKGFGDFCESLCAK